MVRALEMAGDDACSFKFVVSRVAEPDRSGHQPVAERFGHVRHDQTRINSATEECPERHLALQAIGHGSTKRGIDFLDQLIIGTIVGVELRDVPVLMRFDMTVSGAQPMSRQQLEHVSVYRRRRDEVSERQETFKCCQVEVATPPLTVSQRG